jgi:hypothetical protein
MCSRIGSLENQLFEERESQRRADPITVQVTQAFCGPSRQGARARSC